MHGLIDLHGIVHCHSTQQRKGTTRGLHNRGFHFLSLWNPTSCRSSGKKSPHGSMHSRQQNNCYDRRSAHTQTDIEKLVEGCGVKKIEKVFAYNFNEVCDKLKDCWEFSKAYKTPSVLLCQCPCVVYGEKKTFGKPPKVDPDKCVNCKICYSIFECPAIYEKDGKAYIDPILCTGCGVCIDICPKDAISL